MKKINNKAFGFINIAIYIFLTDILTLLLISFRSSSNSLFLNILYLIPPVIVALILIYINKDLFKDKFIDFKKNFPKYFNLAFKYYICGLIAMIMASNLINLFTSPISENETLNRQILTTLPLYAVISMVIIAPISEEITFRGSFKKGYHNKAIYLILTSFLFGIMHVIFNGDFLNFLPYSALAIFLGKIYYESDNILLSISTHAFHNALCIILLYLGSVL